MSKKNNESLPLEEKKAQRNQEKAFRAQGKDVIIRFLVKPGSAKTIVPAEVFPEYVSVTIQAPPDKGKANRELLKELKKLLKVSSSDLVIERGQTSSEKFIRVKNQELETISLKFEEKTQKLS